MKSASLWIAIGALAANLAAALTFFYGGEEPFATAESRIRLSGHVPPRAAIHVVETPALALGPDQGLGVSVHSGWQTLAVLDLSANTPQYSVHLISHNAETIGTPGIVDLKTGEVIQYRLKLGNADVDFVGAEAHLAAVAKDAGPQNLEIELPPTVSRSPGGYVEQLVLVIAAH